jgi:enoyl-CoA hydratase
MIAIDTLDGQRSITLDRADRGNALSADLVDSLIAAIGHACLDDSIHTLVLRAAGRNFCTGFDLSDLDASTEGDLLLRFVRVEQLLGALWHAPMRTVAIAQGRAWGAGADLFACCDERIGLEDCSFRFPGAGFGLVLGSRRLAERVGTDRARRWVIEGRHIEATEALTAGMATELVADAYAAAETLARRAAIAPETARAIRQATRIDLRDADLAALVRSASAPGLKDRIVAYRNAVRNASGKA